MDGLTFGRMVHFVTENLSERPAVITKVWNAEGTVNLDVFQDASMDGHNPPLIQKTSVRYSAPITDGANVTVLAGNTWHWPERA